MGDFNTRRLTLGGTIDTYGNVQEVVEHCLSYFWDRLSQGGSNEWPEIEMLCEDIGTTDEELFEAFKLLGYDYPDEDSADVVLGEYNFEEADYATEEE